MKAQALKNRDIILDIRNRLYWGVITYDEAKAEAEPIIEKMNERIAEIAKKHGKRPYKLSFAALMR